MTDQERQRLLKKRREDKIEHVKAMKPPGLSTATWAKAVDVMYKRWPLERV